MSDAARKPKKVPDKKGANPEAKSGLMDDPVVRFMLLTCLGLIVLYLVGVVVVLGTGVTQKTGPRSAAEKNLMMASEALSPQAKGDAWAPYINALVDAGDYSAAKLAVIQARASITGTMTAPGVDLADARLLSAQNKYSESVTAAKKAMATYKSDYEKRKKAFEKTRKGQMAPSLGKGYYDGLLVAAYSSRELGKWKDAVGYFDIYLGAMRTASDIFIDRGNAKIQLNDKKGAEKDFREALKYVPYDKEAQAGLKRIGVAR